MLNVPQISHVPTPGQMGALFAALALAQGEFKPIERNKTVKVTMKSGGSYTFDYADLSEIIDKTRPALAKHGLAMLQFLGERTEQDENGKTLTLGVLTTALVHKDGGYIGDVMTFSLGGSNQDMGGDITYKRRYGASAVLMIAAETDDDGGTGTRSKAESRDLADRRPAGQRAEMNPKTATADEAEAIAFMKGAKNIAELTKAFNGLPAEQRRPGTTAHNAFQAKRTELAPDAT